MNDLALNSFKNFTDNRLKKTPEKLSFGRAPNPEETIKIENDIKEGFENIHKRMFFIMPQSSMPSSKGENTGWGSPFSESAKKFVKFIKSLGFIGIFSLPESKTKDYNPSPYEGSYLSNSEILIDLKQLISPKWANILSQNKFDEIVKNMPESIEDLIDGINQNKDRPDRILDIVRIHNKKNYGKFRYALKSYIGENGALRESYSNFINQKEENPLVKQLNQEFEIFKKDNENWINRHALYEVLAKKHNNDYFPNWPDKLHRELFRHIDDIDSSQHKNALDEKEKIENNSENEKEIDFYKFCQFIYDKQNKDKKDFNKSVGILEIGDVPVGFGPRDVWSQPLAYLEYPKYHNVWYFPVPDPSKIFEGENNEKLGPAGKVIREKFDKYLKNYDGIRIDAATYYDDFEIKGEGIPKSIKWPQNLLSKLFKNKGAENYHQIYDKIIHKAVKENNIDEKNVFAEALSNFSPSNFSITNNWQEWKEKFINQRLDGFRSIFNGLLWYKLKDAPKNSIASVNSHDYPSIKGMLSQVENFDTQRVKDHKDKYLKPQRKDEVSGKYAGFIDYLAEYTLPVNFMPEKPQEERIKEYKNKLQQDDKEFIKAKFTELFLCPAKDIAVTFMDLLYMKEVYNNGEDNLSNWRLRIPDNYRKIFFENNDALNIPEILKTTLEIKQEKEGHKNYQSLIERLKQDEQILKEKTSE